MVHDLLYVQVNIIISSLPGLEKLTSSFGLLGLFEGFACLIGTPIAGAVYDATKSFIIPFYMASGFFILASLFGFLTQILHKRHNNKSENTGILNEGFDISETTAH